MATKPPKGDPVQDAPQVTEPKHAAAGLPAIGHTLRIAQQQMGVRRTALTLLRVNQKDGFDCPGCAWPEPDHRHAAEFCENGAKAVAEEATLRRITPEFFAAHPVADLANRSGAALIHHTGCGLQTLTEDFRHELELEVGQRPAWAVEAFRDVDQDVRQSMQRVRTSPFLPHTDDVRGFVFDVTTGLLREIAPNS